MNNEIIVIGKDGHNALGVIRSLAESGFYPYVIIISNSRYSYVSKSKYIKKAWVIPQNEEEVLKALWTLTTSQRKNVIIPTSDYAVKVIDDNLDVLSKNFIVPHIDKTQGAINKMMEKDVQVKLAQDYGLNVAKTWHINLEDISYVNDLKCVTYPCIIKPLASVDGNKDDIRICNKSEELNESIKGFISKRYSRVLVQEYIDIEYEIDIPGYLYEREIFAPAIIKKERIYPKKRGSTSFGTINELEKLNIKPLLDFVISLNYNGVFDIEAFVSKGTIIFNEINFRNSATTYALTDSNIYIVAAWIKRMLIKQSPSPYNLKVGSKFMEQRGDISYLIKEKYSFKKWIQEYRDTDIFLRWTWTDLRPFIYEIIYFILRK